MDKRTLLFVISLSISLMIINTFFDYRNQEAKTEWLQEQTHKSKQKIHQLEERIEQNSASPDSLPLIKLFSDNKGTHFLTAGVVIGENILTLSWDQPLPNTLYAETLAGIEEFQLRTDLTKENTPVIYSKSTTPIQIGYLPQFGQYELQAITLHPHDDTDPYSITVAEYIDGQFSIPAEEVAALKAELKNEPKSNSEKPNHENAIILYKSEGNYLPVAVYNNANEKFTYLSDIKNISSQIIKPKTIKTESGSEKPAEKYYVLENDYQQLVFSSYGGALAEINLPFHSKDNEASVVKPIEFDREMVEDHPYNAHFPAHPYFTQGTNPQGPYIEHQSGTLAGYYPLIRRDLIEVGKRKSIQVAPRFYASNIVSEYSEVAEMVYEVTYFDKNKIVFESTQDRRRITKTYTINNGSAPYTIDLTIKVEGDGRGLWLTTGIPETELISDAFSPALKYRITRGNKSEVKLLDLPTETLTMTSSQPDWLCNSNGFFGIILDPLTEIDPGYRAVYVPGNLAPSRLLAFNRERFIQDKLPGYEMMLPLAKAGVMKFRLFAGPFSSPILKQVDKAYSDPTTGYNPDYIACQTFHGWFAFISEPFAKFLFFLMTMFHSVTGSWAFSIILLTIALRVMMYPLNAWSTKSMLRTQQYMPKIQAIQQKYKNDPKKAQIEVMNFYKEQGINPLSGLTGGCFPLLIQMPFLIGMFDLLKSSFQLRGASFIPGWIDNLAAPDVLFSWTTPIPLIGNEFHLLPVILGVIMFFQPRLTSPLPKNKNEWSEQQRQQRVMGNIMAIMFTWLFYNFPSGLNIYWISSMLLGMLQQWWNKRNLITPPMTIIDPKKKNIPSR